ncbi:NAD(P)-binding protein [Exidia glandulosa HHB12029]|uniref:NAD(P)-binding protein n=1 Tax=Exidia glandulosa HHB12029 TaxID=1314781 RepID=A0A165KTJ9_EXIGL|nr:NAD(P)-binding protein [Exidia glandulosa HHB12029]
MSAYARIIAVTGANKGIGLAIVRNIALQYPSSTLNSGPLLLYLTARDTTRGNAAIDALNAEEKFAKVLKAHGGPVSVAFKQLDISNTASIDGFAADLQREHGQIDIVVNNAGIALDGFDAEVVNKTLATNYHCTLYATLAFLKLLKPAYTSRLVNVASTAGRLSQFPASLQKRFIDASNTPDDGKAATVIMRDFEEAVKAGGKKHEALGFPSAAYSTSKAGLIAATRAVALRVAKENDGAKEFPLVNSCCPGWVNTDMTKGKGPKTVDQGAKTPVYLAMENLGGKYGEFWRDEKIIEW